MRILLLCHYYPPEIGAAPRRLNGFVKRWMERGCEVTVITGLPHYPQGTLFPGWSFRRAFRSESGAYGERIIRVPFFPEAGRNLTKLLDHLLVAGCAAMPGCFGRRTRVDVVVASIPSVPMIGSALAVHWLRRIPVVLDMRDPWPDSLLDSGVLPALLARPIVRAVTAAQRIADAIVCVPAGFPARLEERGVSAAKTHLIPNGVDVENIPVLPEPPLDRYRLRVLYLGTLGRAHNLNVVIDALAALGAEKVEGRIIGDGTERASVMAYARERNAPVRFEPPVAGEDLWKAYEWADTCIVSVSDWPTLTYIVPAKLYEIMACGRHVTAAIRGAAEEVIRESGKGMVVEPGNAVEFADALAVLQADRTRLIVGDAPRRWVAKNADSDSLADSFLGVLEGLITWHGNAVRVTPVNEAREWTC